MTTLHAVDHVQLPIAVGGSATARYFYATLLGLKEIDTPALAEPGTLHFSVGWQRLDLREGAYSGVAPQAHLALRIGDLGLLIERLRYASHRVDTQQLAQGRAYVDDPFGNRLELLDARRHGAPEEAPRHVRDLHFSV